jgi:hypothetical protein
MNFTRPAVAGLLLVLVGAGPASQPAAPLKLLTIESIIKSVPKESRGPDNIQWTEVQNERYVKALHELLDGKQFKMQCGTIAQVREKDGETIIGSTTPGFKVGSVAISNVGFSIHPVAPLDAAKLQKGDRITVTGICSRARIDGGYSDRKGSKSLQIYLTFSDAEVSR